MKIFFCVASTKVFAVLLVLIVPSAATMSTSPNQIALKSSCACGKVALTCTLTPDREEAAAAANAMTRTNAECLDCHCPACRRFHDSAFVSYLKVDPSLLTITKGTEADDMTTYSDTCRPFGPSERVACRHCSSKLFTRLKPAMGKNTDGDGDLLVNLGCIEDQSIPKNLALAWRASRAQYAKDSKAPWLDARPGKLEQKSQKSPLRMPELSSDSRFLTGSCACQRHLYRIRLDETPSTTPFSSELQHCYCKLCRQLSGGPFMTWIPVEQENFEWYSHQTTSGHGEPPLIRTTSHGQRHICQTCRSVMTIVYDEQPETVWPVAASLHDDDSDEGGQANRALLLHQCEYDRVLHICCRYKQPWYQLPKDGLERVQEAC